MLGTAVSFKNIIKEPLTSRTTASTLTNGYLELLPEPLEVGDGAEYVQQHAVPLVHSFLSPEVKNKISYASIDLLNIGCENSVYKRRLLGISVLEN